MKFRGDQGRHGDAPAATALDRMPRKREYGRPGGFWAFGSRESPMSRFARSLFAALLGLSAALAAAPSSRAADLGVYVEGDSGVCAETWVLARITRNFSYQVRHVPNLPNVSIMDFHNIQERRYLPSQDEWPIGRRYCEARVALSDGDDRQIWYLIEEGQGFASIGHNVEFCVSGFDRWYVYNGRCRVLH